MNTVSSIRFMNSGFMGASYFLLLVICMVLPSSKLSPDPYVLFMQVMMALISVLVVYISRSVSKGGLLFAIFIINLLTSLAVRYFYISHWNDSLGPIAIDALAYHLDAIQSSNLSLSEFVKACKHNSDIDDCGFAFILYSLYSIFGSSFGIHVALLFNSIAVVLMCNYTYKLANYYIRPEFAKVVIAILGTMPYAIVTSANGLKENFFAFFLVGAVYHAVRFCTIKSLVSFIEFVIFAALTVFFRLAIFPILIVAIISVKFAKYVKINARNIIIMVVLFCGCAYFGSRLLSYLITMRGLSDNIFSDMLEMQYVNSGLSELQVMVANSFFAIIGPIPSFVSTYDKISYITMPNFTAFISIIFGSLFVSGFLKAINRRNHVFIILTTILLNCLMILLMSFSFDFRYRFIIFPFILILTALGIQEMKKKELPFHQMYVFSSLLLILFYNVVF